MNLKNIAETLRTHFNYIFYDKLNYALALPLSAVAATQFYLGRPAYGVRDVLLSLILLDVIGMHRALNQELKESYKQREGQFNFQNEGTDPLADKIRVLADRFDGKSERFLEELRGIRESLKELERRLS